MSHHRDNPNAVQRAFTERQKSLRETDEIYRPDILAFQAEVEGRFKAERRIGPLYCPRCQRIESESHPDRDVVTLSVKEYNLILSTAELFMRRAAKAELEIDRLKKAQLILAGGGE